MTKIREKACESQRQYVSVKPTLFVHILFFCNLFTVFAVPLFRFYNNLSHSPDRFDWIFTNSCFLFFELPVIQILCNPCKASG